MECAFCDKLAVTQRDGTFLCEEHKGEESYKERMKETLMSALEGVMVQLQKLYEEIEMLKRVKA